MTAEHLSDDSLWASVDAAVRGVLLPALTDEHARAVAIQLVGLSAYARTRGSDPTALRHEQLGTALESLRANPLVAPHWPGTPLVVAGSVLAAAASRDDAAAVEVRRVLHPLLVGFLDADIAATTVLGPAFRGRLPDA